MTSDTYCLHSLLDHCYTKFQTMCTNSLNDDRLSPPEGYLYEAEQTARLLLEQLDTTVAWQKNTLQSFRDHGQL